MNCFDPLRLSMIADGESAEPGIEQHLQSCADCRGAVERQRRLKGLVAGGSPKSPCPSGDEIARYLAGAADATEIEAHAADCGPCRRMIFAPPAETAALSPDFAARVRSRLQAGSHARILRLAASVAAVLMIGLAVWLVSIDRQVPFTHASGQVEDVSLSLSMSGAVTVADGARVDLTHSVREAYEQKILRLEGSHPVEVERRSRDSSLVVRLRRTPAGKTEVATVTPSGTVELLSVSDNLAVDEACQLLLSNRDEQRKVLNRLLPKGISIESMELSRDSSKLHGSATLRVTASEAGTRTFEFPISGEIRESGSDSELVIEGHLGASATIRFAIRRVGR